MVQRLVHVWERWPLCATWVMGKSWVGPLTFPRLPSTHPLPLIPQTLSMLPTRILRLLEFVGFSGNKVTGNLWVSSVCPVQSWSWARHSGAEGPWGLVPILA